MPRSGNARTVLLTIMALVAFAANSVLCRLALESGSIDAASFSTVRLSTGAAALMLISTLAGRGTQPGLAGDWPSAFALFLYAVPFSFAYETLSAGTGALLLFGAVQATMILAALSSGERPHPLEWAGLAIALSGLVYLVLPGVEAPPPAGSALMLIAGIAWGWYSLRGRSARDALRVTTGNFVRCVPLVLAVSLATRAGAHSTMHGALLASASGALASGVGYALWYAALSGLSATRAATVQLSVPVLAALGGVILLAEGVSARLLLSSALVLGGVGLALAGRGRPRAAP